MDPNGTLKETATEAIQTRNIPLKRMWKRGYSLLRGIPQRFSLSSRDKASRSGSKKREVVEEPSDISTKLTDNQPQITEEYQRQLPDLGSDIWMTIFAAACKDYSQESENQSQEDHEKFQASAEQREENESSPRRRLHLTPLFLSHVSKEWRNLVHSTPVLWNEIVIDFEGKYQLEKLHLWLTKSMDILGGPEVRNKEAMKVGGKSSDGTDEDNRPLSKRRLRELSIRIDIPHWRWNNQVSEDSFKKCFRLMHRHSFDVTNLSFTIPSDMVKWWCTLLEDCKIHHSCTNLKVSQHTDFRHLRTLGVHTYFTSSGGYDRQERLREASQQEALLFRLLCSASNHISMLTFADQNKTCVRSPYFLDPAILSADLSARSLSTLTNVVSLTLQSIKIRHLDHYPYFLLSLSSLVRLNTLHLLSFDISCYGDIERGQPRYDLPSLHTLHILKAGHEFGHDTCETVAILDHLRIPHLTELRVASSAYRYTADGGDAWKSVKNMLSASASHTPTLRALSMLSARRYSHPEWDLLASPWCKGLEELIINSSSYTNNDTISLLYNINATARTVPVAYTLPLLPRLKRLTIYRCGTIDGRLAKMAKSRLLNGGTLEYLYVEVLGNIQTYHSKDREALSQINETCRDRKVRLVEAPPKPGVDEDLEMRSIVDPDSFDFKLNRL